MTRTCSYIKFLWLPKVINGKLYWLRNIRVTETKTKVMIHGEERVVSAKIEYKVL
jgi:hypothetical protein